MPALAKQCLTQMHVLKVIEAPLLVKKFNSYYPAWAGENN